MNRICAIIPARYQSSRLPGKPLLTIGDKTIIQMTYEQTCKCKYIDKVYVVTDDDRIVNEVNTFSTSSALKSEKECLNGTERICNVLEQIDSKYDIIVNVQGDEPYINPENIDLAIEKYIENEQDPTMVCTTIHSKISNDEDLYNRSIGKMVMDKNDNVMYCSRTMIPHTKTGLKDSSHTYNLHIGIFVYRRSFLPLFLDHKSTPAQLAEDIEWLKIIEMGYRIKSYAVSNYEIGVNTAEDYKKLLAKYGNEIA